MPPAKVLALGLATGGLLALLALGVALPPCSLLVLGPFPGWYGGHDITAVILRLALIHGHSCHGLKARAQSQLVCHLGQLLQVGQLRACQVCLDGTGNLMVKVALKNAVPSLPGGQNSRSKARTSDGRWLLLATTCRHFVAFCTGVS